MTLYTSRTWFVNLMAVHPGPSPLVILQGTRSEEGSSMVQLQKPRFDAAAFLARAGLGRRIIQLAPKEVFFSQGDPADSISYLQQGRARVTVVSAAGKEATITLLSAGDFVGEEALAAMPGLRLATATAITACTALRISRGEMIRVMHEEHGLSDFFLKFLLERSMRTQADLVDQLFNSSEKRLARILLLMAEFSLPGEREQYIPKITQETLAEMIGTTRSRVSFFMNRFRELGFIEYNGRIKVHKSLLNAVLLDRLPERNPGRSPGSPFARSRSKPARLAQNEGRASRRPARPGP
jgi:CRP/FNR family transcriptional regulator, cyclic AMP receptor protein